MSNTKGLQAGPQSKVISRSLTVWRRMTQVAGMMIMGQWSYYGIFRCPFIVPYVSCQNCPVITCHGRLLTMFWGLWLLPLGVLVFRSGFLPRFLGVWLFINGLAYIVISSTSLFSPHHLDLVSTATTPMLAGEVALVLWLLIVGARDQPRER